MPLLRFLAVASIALSTGVLGCATVAGPPDPTSLDYGPCPTDYVEKAKAAFVDDADYELAGEPLVYPPRRYWYREAPVSGGELLTGHIVPVTVDLTETPPWGRPPGRHTFGLLFRGDRIVKRLPPEEVDLRGMAEPVGPLPPKDDREWTEGFTQEGLIEWVLPGETVQDWSELITFRLHRFPPDRRITEIAEGTRELFEEMCRHVEWNLLSEGAGEVVFERNTTSCAPMRDEYAIDRLIRGVNVVIQVAYAKTTPLSEDEKEKWLGLLSEVKLLGDCSDELEAAPAETPVAESSPSSQDR